MGAAKKSCENYEKGRRVLLDLNDEAKEQPVGNPHFLITQQILQGHTTHPQSFEQ
jgi:hypothetical protein